LDDDGDGFAIFDLTVNDLVMLQGLDPLDYNVSYYEVGFEAENDINPIANPTTYQNVVNPQTIYTRVSDIQSGLFVTASFVISLDVLSVNAFALEDLSVFPNPTTESFTVQSQRLASETVVSFYDVQGKMLFSEKVNMENGNFTINISTLDNGIYFVKIYSEGNVAVRKLMKN